MNRVLMIVFSYYPADPRVRREAEALDQAGYAVDVICLRDKNQAAVDIFNGVRIFRVPLERKRGGKMRYIFEYFVFILLAMFKTVFLRLQYPYVFTHVHNMPDVLVYCAWMPKLTGSKIILDLHDPVPEVFIAKYNLDWQNKFIKLFVKLEKYSIAFADVIITPNIAFKNIFASRSCPAEKIKIVMNSPQEDLFASVETAASPPKYLPDLMFHGTVVERHGLGEALRAVKLLMGKYPGIRLKVFGDGDYVKKFLELRAELNLQNHVHYGGRVTLEQIS